MDTQKFGRRMVDDQSDRLTRLEVNVQHVMDTQVEIKTALSNLPTRIELAQLVSKAEYTTITNNFETRIQKLEAQTPRSLMKATQEIAVTITAIAAAGGLLSTLMYFVNHK